MFDNIKKHLGEKKYRITQLEHAIFRELVEKIEDITVFPKELRDKLKNEELFLLKTEKILSSKKTTKVLFMTKDGHKIESVLMRHKNKERNTFRNTICVSSQIGCPCGCKFCATGAMGLIRNLSAQEIVEQVLFFSRLLKSECKDENWNNNNPPQEHRVRNVVFMGMGEPLLNLDNVLEAVKTLNDDKKLGIGSRRITISTVGIIPGIQRLSELDMQINLAVSLHFPDDKLRSEIMPQNKIYPLEDLMQTLWEFSDKTLRRIFFEYTVIDGVNDSLEMAEKLGELLENYLCHVNFIPLNENESLENELKKPKLEKIRKMQRVLDDFGISSTIRTEFGGDIEGACGQLAGS